MKLRREPSHDHRAHARDGVREPVRDPVVAAGWYKAIFEDVIAQTGLEVTMWTSSESDRSLVFDKAFIEECVALGCNLELITEIGASFNNINMAVGQRIKCSRINNYFLTHSPVSL